MPRATTTKSTPTTTPLEPSTTMSAAELESDLAKRTRGRRAPTAPIAIEQNQQSVPTYAPRGTTVACDFCRRRKEKCVGGQPCRSCSGRNIPCTFYDVPKDKKGKKLGAIPTPPKEHIPTPSTSAPVKAATAGTGSKRGPIAPIACILCRDRRKKCTNEKPKCLQCVRRGSACVYPARRTNNAKRGKKSMQEEDEEDEEELEPDVYSDEDMEGGHEQSYSPPSSPEPTPPPPSIRFASSSRDPFHPSNKFYKEDNPYAAGFETSPLYRDYTYPGKPSYYSNNYHYDDNIYPSRIHFYNSNSPDPHHHYHTELPHILCPVCRRLTCGCGGAYYIPDGTDPIYADSYLNTQTPISDLRSEPSPSMGVPRKDFESG